MDDVTSILPVGSRFVPEVVEGVVAVRDFTRLSVGAEQLVAPLFKCLVHANAGAAACRDNVREGEAGWDLGDGPLKPVRLFIKLSWWQGLSLELECEMWNVHASKTI